MARPSPRGALALLCFALALAAPSGCATTSAAQEALGTDGPIIDSLEIEGTKAVDEDDLKKRILTSASHLQGLPIVGEIQRFDPNNWQADLRRIERAYQARGYYQAKVVDEHILPAGPDHVRLVVRVFEGEQTLVSKVEVRGLESLPAAQRLTVLEDLPIQPGQPFLEAGWEAQKALLAQRLRDQGYAEASLTGEAQVDVATHKAEVTLEVTPGLRYRFGRIVVATDPNAKVAPWRITERVKGAITPGAWYNDVALADAQARVFQMGVFAGVKLTRGAPDREEGTVPIVVDVREAPFHTRRTGLGLGVDQTRQEGRVTGEYTDRNFLGGLRRYTLRGKVGYAFLPDILSVARGAPGSKSGLVANLVNEFEQPRLFNPYLSLQSTLELQSGLEPAYDFQGGSFRVGTPWRPWPDLVVFPSVNFDLYFLSSPAPLGGRSPEVTFGCPSPCVLAYLEQTVELDRRDDRVAPREGYYIGLSLQEGGGPRPSVPPPPEGETEEQRLARESRFFSYLRFLPEVRGYTSFGLEKRVTLSARLKLGTILSQGAAFTPIVARFFSGGADMRGFNTRRLSPLAAVADTEDPTQVDTVPVGGNGLFEAATELRYRFYGDFTFALFLDTGFVTPEELNLSSARYYSENMLAAAGFGFRYMTPFGPIRVDLARRLPIGRPLPVDTGNIEAPFRIYNNCFGLGDVPPGYPGSPEGLCTFHLSIGEAF
ncbi:MAG: autotransporter assembly complex protein TamA [Myxococcaceae bacterium]